MKKFTHIGALHQVARAIRVQNEDPECPERYKVRTPVSYRGTVKLHGTNAGVALREDLYQPQSRSREISETEDNLGFAKFIGTDARKAVIRTIESRIRRDHGLEADTILTIFGEWCGPGIQKGCGIHKLPERQFVIFAAAAGDGDQARYLDISKFNSIRDEFTEDSIYWIQDAHVWGLEINFQSPESLEEAAEWIAEETKAVEDKCPWASKWGIEGIGEGIVWTPLGEHLGRSDLFFKSKGDKHKVTKSKSAVQVDPEVLANTQAFVDYMVTENRLHQGLDFLREQGLPFEMKSVGSFLKWFSQDVAREGATELEANGLAWKQVAKSVTNAARKWYLNHVQSL